MWTKDSAGNWYLADQPALSGRNITDSGSTWLKDSKGNWFIAGRILDASSRNISIESLHKMAS